MKFLIILPFYQRPIQIFKNALLSIKQLEYDSWHLAFIDDGSVFHGRPIVEEFLPDHQDKITYYRCDDTPEQKLAQGGSRHGEYMNKAILESDADAVVILCDDDALHPKYFTNLNDWFTRNRHKKYCYSHIIPFDPEKENPFQVEIRSHVTNVTGLIHCSNRVDSSQVAFRRSCFTEGGASYKSPRTKNLDSDLFAQLFELYGPCHYTGFYSQYKGWFRGQLGNFTEADVYNGNLDYIMEAMK